MLLPGVKPSVLQVPSVLPMLLRLLLAWMKKPWRRIKMCIRDRYEAARVDGAGRFQLMRYITLPELMPTYFVMLMLSVANFLNNGMDQYFVFQNAFNKAHIQVLDLYVYNIGMTGSSLSLATAISMLKSLISVTLLMAVNRISKKIRGVSLV